MSSPAAEGTRPPSVERVLLAARERSSERREPSVLLEAARAVVDEERVRLTAGMAARTTEVLGASVIDRLDGHRRADMDVVLNATGVVIHTNLGRAPWSSAAIEAASLAADTVLLEIARETGRRGHRFRRAEEHLMALTGAEDALVTNNNAAGLALAVALVGRGRGVAVSRGELVEIGGGVRIPEIVRRAGARLVEVGTTNRTRAADFEAPLAEGRAAAVLRVHPSNFTQSGFTESPDPSAVAEVAHRHGAIVLDDLGSGALLPTERYGLAHEPTPAERLEAGADVVMFSGDKLVGGPQAGLVAGRADLVPRMRRDPLARAMRPDKATLLAVAATLAAYRAGVAETTIPVWRMLAADPERLRARAEMLAQGLGGAASVVSVASTIGGGALPGQTLPSWAVALRHRSAARLLRRLRLGTPAVVGRIEDDLVLLDVRTVSPERDTGLLEAVRLALAG